MREYYLSRKGEKVCRCPALPYPHRLDCKPCRDLYDSGNELTYETYPARDEYADFKSEMNSLRSR